MKRIAMFFERRPWWLALGVLVIFWGLAYMVPNHLDNRPVKKVIDRVGDAIPFVDWTVVIYLSVFILIGVGIFILAREERGRATVTVLLLIAIHLVIFYFHPTLLPRNRLVPGADWQWVYRILWALDSPRNCFPSLHVSVAMLATLMLWRRHKFMGLVFFVWVLAVALSTLTTKQHYVADVVWGGLLAVAVYIVTFHIFVRFVPPRE